MLNRDFNTWLSGFRGSIADYGYYIDFEKVYRNIDKIRIELNIMNSLIGSKNIKADFKDLMKKYPEVMKCIPLLLAVRASEIYCQDENGGWLYQFDFGKYPPNSHAHYERYSYFMEQTGLFNWLYKFFWGLGGTYPFHCGVLTPYLYTCWGNKRPSKINVVLNKGYTS